MRAGLVGGWGGLGCPRGTWCVCLQARLSGRIAQISRFHLGAAGLLSPPRHLSRDSGGVCLSAFHPQAPDRPLSAEKQNGRRWSRFRSWKKREPLDTPGHPRGPLLPWGAAGRMNGKPVSPAGVNCDRKIGEVVGGGGGAQLGSEGRVTWQRGLQATPPHHYHPSNISEFLNTSLPPRN